MLTLRLLCFIVIGALIAGCAAVPNQGYLAEGRYCYKKGKNTLCTTEAVPATTVEANAKQFARATGDHIVWITRNGKFDTFGKVTVTASGREIDTFPQTVSRLVVAPGALTMAIPNRTRGQQVVTISGEAGAQTYVDLTPDVGLFRTYFSLQQIAEKEGRQKVLAGKLIKAS